MVSLLVAAGNRGVVLRSVRAAVTGPSIHLSGSPLTVPWYAFQIGESEVSVKPRTRQAPVDSVLPPKPHKQIVEDVSVHLVY